MPNPSELARVEEEETEDRRLLQQKLTRVLVLMEKLYRIRERWAELWERKMRQRAVGP